LIIKLKKEIRTVEIGQTYPEPKDIKRLQDIKTKSGADLFKAVSLATSMANKITDRDKAARRKGAADQIFGAGSEISGIFEKRWHDLDSNQLKRGELIDEILAAFDYKSGCIVDIDHGAKVELELFEDEKIFKIIYVEPKNSTFKPFNGLSTIFKKLPTVVSLADIFPCKKIEGPLIENIIHEFDLGEK